MSVGSNLDGVSVYRSSWNFMGVYIGFSGFYMWLFSDFHATTCKRLFSLHFSGSELQTRTVPDEYSSCQIPQRCFFLFEFLLADSHWRTLMSWIFERLHQYIDYVWLMNIIKSHQAEWGFSKRLLVMAGCVAVTSAGTFSGTFSHVQPAHVFGTFLNIWHYQMLFWLVVWNIFIFPYIGNNHSNWLIFFRGVETTNQYSYWSIGLKYATVRFAYLSLNWIRFVRALQSLWQFHNIQRKPNVPVWVAPILWLLDR